jgi:PAS domain S-box-containing protein
VTVASNAPALQDLHQNHAVLEALNATIPAAVLVVRVDDGEIVLANAEAHRILGSSVTELFGDSWNNLFARSEDRQEILVQFTGDGQLRDYEVEIILPDGSQAWVVISMTSVDSDTDDPDQDDLLVMTLIDVTPIKGLQTRAELSSQAKTRFLSNMSHELRTPLNSVLGFSQMLEGDPEQPLTPDQADSVQEIWRAGRHLLNLINDILDLTKIEDDDLTLVQEPVDLDDLLAGCLQLIAEQAEDRDVTVTLGELQAVSVMANAARLRQVVMNLLSNAVKFNKPNGSIVIASHLQFLPESQKSRALISISDTGVGISPKAAETLFQPFDNAASEDNAEEGAGIGLVIAHRLALAMGGDITFESEPDVGSTFTVHMDVS